MRPFTSLFVILLVLIVCGLVVIMFDAHQTMNVYVQRAFCTDPSILDPAQLDCPQGDHPHRCPSCSPRPKHSSSPSPSPHHGHNRLEKLKDQVREIYKYIVYPTPDMIFAGQVNLSKVFNLEVAKGRVDPLGTFETPSLLVEYFYGLVNPSSFIRVISTDVTDLVAEGDEVYVSANVLFAPGPNATITGNQTISPYNLTESGRFLFDDSDRVISCDVIIHNIGKISDRFLQPTIDTIEYACAILLISPGRCNSTVDPDGYYTSFEDCVEFLSSINFGSFNDAASNTTVCRFLHSLLTVYDPVMHCPHAGKTGGDKCIYFPPEDYYQVSY